MDAARHRNLTASVGDPDAYAWPGNVRELENAIHRAVIIGKSDVIQPEDLPTDIRNGATKKNARRQLPWRKTKHGNELISRTVAEHNGNVAAAAPQIGVSESYIYRVLRQGNGGNSHN